MTVTIDQDRLNRIVALKSGNHDKNDGEALCVMEAVAWVTHKTWSDHPPGVCPVIGAFMRSWNDGLPTDEDRTRLLKPLIPKLVNTRGGAKLERRRATMAADWLVRSYTPAWLRLAKLETQADLLEALPEITDLSKCPSLMPTLDSVRSDAAAAWAAARDAAGAAAWDAARDAAGAAAWAAAWAAARDAAGAAWDAAGDAARDAAGAAAWAAAWAAAGYAAGAAARDALKETTATLQASALALVERMIPEKDEGGHEQAA